MASLRASLPASSVYYGTDASGGPRGADPRLRVVSWVVVAICVCPSAGGGERSGFQIVGSMTGAVQIGATVNDGESYALNQLVAEWASSPVCVAVDSKAAIKRCGKPDIHKQMPGSGYKVEASCQRSGQTSAALSRSFIFFRGVDSSE